MEKAKKVQKNTMVNDYILRDAVTSYGPKHQVQKAVEEMAELIQALCKYDDFKDEACYEHVVEEIADVLLVIDQLKIVFDITEEEIETFRTYKLNRLASRISCHEAEKARKKKAQKEDPKSCGF